MQKKTQEQFLQEAVQVHGDKYDYSLVNYINTKTPVEIICKRCGRHILVQPRQHIYNFCGCKYCSKAKTTEQFIEEARKVHGDKYDYSKVNYTNNRNKVEVICSKHGPFMISPHLHLRFRGCPQCAKELRAKTASNNKRKTVEQFVQEARAVHGDKYDYSKVEYTGTDNKVTIICPKHGEFLQTPYQHVILQNGCPRCNSSKGEMAIMRYLDSHNIRYIYDKACLGFLGKLRPDFYLPDYRMIIEYDGLQHFEPVDRFDGEEGLKETQERDNIKESLCQDNNVKVLRISYIEYKDIEDILEENL